jgi:hypothetical protein
MPLNHGRGTAAKLVCGRATVLRGARFAADDEFPGAEALGRITSLWRSHGRPAEPQLVRYFLLSKYVSAKRLLAIVRSHCIGCSMSS